MEHFILFFYVLSFSSGIAACNVLVVLYFQYKKKIIKHYMILLLSLVLIIASYILSKYVSIVSPSSFDFLYILSGFFIKLGFVILICIIPYFSHSIMGIYLSQRKKYFFTVVDIVVIINMCLIFFRLLTDVTALWQVEYFMIDSILGFIIIYGFYVIIADINSIADKKIKNALIGFLIFTVLFFPVYIIEGYRFRIIALRHYQIIEIISLPLYFFILNTFSTVFFIKYYNQPSFLENNTLSHYFKSKYRITEREETIIEYLLKGLTNTQISKKLFISSKTVENHLSNIYNKVEVKNRVQLVSLILQNR